MKTINATISYTMQAAPQAICKKFNKPAGTIEVLDSDGFRECFAETEEAAVEAVAKAVEDALGLSGGIALGTVKIEVTDK